MHPQAPNLRTFFSALALSALFAAACSGGGSSKPDVTFTDASPPVPDASIQLPPDAAVCTTTTCDGACVDTATDPLNCGGCGMACASPGQICSGALPCECPADFVPASIGGGGFDQIQAQAGAIIALAPSIGATLDVTAVVYDLTLEVGTVYDLATGLGTLTPPAVAAGYDVDINSFTAHTAYGATAGTITFDTICDVGASGTMANVVFSEVLGVTDPTAVEGGCSMSYDSLAFAIGDACPAI